MKEKKHIRFPILLKVILLGVITSFVASTVAIVVNYNNLQQRAIQDRNESAIESLQIANSNFDITLSASASNIESFEAVKDYVFGILSSVPADDPINTARVENYPSFEAYEKVYRDEFNYYYPEGIPGSQGYLAFRSHYNRVNPFLLNASVYSGQPAYYAVKHPSIENRLIFIGDSRLETYKKQNSFYHVAGSYYDIKPTDQIIDIGHDYIKEYRLDKYSTRFIEVKKQNNETGNLDTIGYMFVEYDVGSIEAEFRPILIREIIILTITGLIVIILYAVLSYFMFVRNINKLHKAAEGISSQLTSDSTFELVDPNIKSRDEMKTLSDSFLAMEHQLINYVDIIKADAKEKEKINAELDIASKIQLEALPNANFDSANISIRSYIKAAKEVGGDFYDYFYINDHELALIISDVSGKGIPAALFMMKSKTLIKSQLNSEPDLSKAIKEVNEVLNENNNESLFVTSFIAVIDFDKEEIRYVNAGHEKPYIISNKKVIKLEGNSNFVLGGVSGIEYKEEKHAFHKGDTIFMFTDGLNESINDTNEEFSYSRIEETINNSLDGSLDELINNMKNALADFTKDKEAFDDVTMVLARFNSDTLKLSFDKKDPSIIEEAVESFESYFPSIEMERKSKVGIVLDELLNNLVSYEKREDLKIDIHFKVTDESIIVEIISNGDNYDPFKNNKEKYLNEFSHEIKEGGFGISLVKQFAKVTNYKYSKGKSVITVEI